MKVAILAGGYGSRLAEETEVKPKPMVEIGGRPILWHIMMHYSCYGFGEFVIALGYKGEVIKKYMTDYCALSSDLTVDLGKREVIPRDSPLPRWTVDLIDTGTGTQTGGRIKRLGPHLGDGTFMLTWGDGVSNVDLHALLAFHRAHGKLATVTAVHPPARYGHLKLGGEQVTALTDETQTNEGWINGAYFVLEPAILDYIDGDETQWEREPMERLTAEGQLMAFRHDSFWQCMDTLREKHLLERLWAGGNAPWKIWE